MVEMVRFNVQRAITPKVGKPELRFMCSAHCIMMFYICVKNRENIVKGIRVMEPTQVHGRIGHVQRVITPKVGKPELWFMCSACHLMWFTFV